MDSGNSGSLQSSSGGEEEYDSRAESISAFLNHHPSTAGGGRHHHPSPPHLSQLPQQQHHHSAMFDPLSNYFDPLSSSTSRSPLPPFTASSSNPNSLLNLDMVWSKGLRSEPNCTDLGGLFVASSLSSSAASSSTQQLFTSQGALQSRTIAAASNFPAAAGLHIPQGAAGSAAPRASVSGLNIDQTKIIISNNHDNSNNSGNNLNMVRNPKKRSRASRRAPTTVLTTDTTNFRAMVQEFTGIPAPPFTSSPFPRTRLDLFGTSGSSLRSTPIHLDSSQPSYLLRPFAQKINPIPFVSPSLSSAAASSSFSSSSMIDALASTTANKITSGSATAASNNIHSNSNSTSINCQLPSDLGGLLKQHQQQPQNLLNINMQNPILNLQSFLQAPQKYPLNSPILETKPRGSLDVISSNDSHLKIGVLDELGLGHSAGGNHHHHHLNASLGGLQNIVSSEAATLPVRSDHQNNPTTWPSSSTNGTGSNENDQGLLRSISSSTGNYDSSQRVINTNGKVINNFIASSSSDFHRHNHRDIRGKAAAENVTTRSEGMVESWICSSD